MVGAGKSATVEDTGFLKSYQGLTPAKDPAFPTLPDQSYISPQARMNNYKKVIMPDFTSMTPSIDKISGLQIRQYKGVKQELPDLIASTFDGSTFPKVSRVSERIDPSDIVAIKKLPADAILMGNIKELVSMGGDHGAGLTAIQIEYKLIDIRTGEEVITAIHRSTTDLDKVAMGQVRVLASLLSKAKSSDTGASTENSQPKMSSLKSTAPVLINAPLATDVGSKTLIGKTITPVKKYNKDINSEVDYYNDYVAFSTNTKIGLPKNTSLFRLIKDGASKSIDVYALTKNGKTSKEFLDLVEIENPKGFVTVSESCKGALFAQFPIGMVFTKPTKAWKVENGKITQMSNLKGVACTIAIDND
jgi:hypothetical protein